MISGQKQLSLFHRAASCRSTPHSGRETSRAAADEAKDHAGRLSQAIMAYLLGRGADGATDYEMQQAIDLDGNSQRPRRVALAGKGLIADSGRVRETGSGRKAVVWIAAPVVTSSPPAGPDDERRSGAPGAAEQDQHHDRPGADPVVTSSPPAGPEGDRRPGTVEQDQHHQRLLGVCHVCGCRRRWESIYGVLICPTCHPPAFPDLVARWIDDQPEQSQAAQAAVTV